MRNLVKSIVLASVLGLVACAKDSGGGGSNQVAVVPQANSCVAGQVYSSQYGCLAQSGCPLSYGNYNGQCIPLMADEDYYYQQQDYGNTGYYPGYTNGGYGYGGYGYGGGGASISGGFYIGGGFQTGVPGMYYGY